MNEYEAVLFNYIQENKMGKTFQRRDYQIVNEQTNALYEAFYNSLTGIQKWQFRRYEEKDNERLSMKEEDLFLETLAAVRTLLTIGPAG